MKKYNVVFTYDINVEAEDEQDAEDMAVEIFSEIHSKPYEFGIMVEEI